MRINADFDQSVVLDTTTMGWVPSPMAGVERKMLDRIGEEVARATSLVRYAPGSRFSSHTHGGGEEYLVVEGTFSDEHGDYPLGTYVRNPIGTSHAPHSDDGCTILVKLHQFEDDDTEQKQIDTANAAFEDTGTEGVTALPLHRHGTEEVRMLRFSPGAAMTQEVPPGGFEALVLEGSVTDDLGQHGTGTWLRRNDGTATDLRSDGGGLLFIKTGHLPAA
ncbi:cupin domain-containing protein [Thalassococcus sp. BH17M4-6]|uniref:cupin domain-containing protein n=1 Tax=Thalassococcus sp. BH17M4-6 TaxID=3413148 RepID=UPI003BDEE5C5